MLDRIRKQIQNELFKAEGLKVTVDLCGGQVDFLDTAAINGPIRNAMCKIDYILQGKILAKCEPSGLGALNRIATRRAQIGKTIRGL